MIPADLQATIEALHAAPHLAVFEFAGAGSLALWWLHSVGGSSHTLLEASDRYSATALADLLGSPPEQAVSVATAQAMARRAYERAETLSRPQFMQQHQARPLIGLACTATIATSYQKRGAHRCVVATHQATRCHAYELTLTTGLRKRTGEETVVSRLVLHALAQSCGLDGEVALGLSEDETLAHHEQPAPDALARLLRAEAASVVIQTDGQTQADARLTDVALLSGAFNPLHEGHRHMAAAAAAHLGRAVVYELPVHNADKGTLIAEEVRRRLSQFAGHATVVLTRVPLFVEKAALFPGCPFVVGYDTAIRLVSPRYYGGEAAMHAAMEQIRAHGCRFLVAGRLHNDHYHTLADVPLPAGLETLFEQLPEAQFRVDISSTDLRQQPADP